MPRLRLYEFELCLTAVEEWKDKAGKRCLTAKGYHKYKYYDDEAKINREGRDDFSIIRLYGSKALLDETRMRFFKNRNLKLIIDVLDADISTVYYLTKTKRKYTWAIGLLVYYYDFKTKRFGTRKLIKKLQEETENE